MTMRDDSTVSGGVMVTGAEQIDFVRLCALRGALRLEMRGLRRRGPSAYSLIKREFGLKGNRDSVYKQFCETIEQRRALLTTEGEA